MRGPRPHRPANPLTRSAVQVGIVLAALVAVLLVWGLVRGDAATDGPEPERLLTDREIVRSSGLARSSFDDKLLFTHNSSPNSARLFAVEADGSTRAVLTVEGADAVDWEGISSGPDATLWIADIGDDEAERSWVTVYRVREPREASTRAVTATPFRFTYPDGAHDARALMVHPTSGGIYIVTHQPTGAAIYRAPHVITTTEVNRLVKVADAPPHVSAATFTPDGGRFVLGTGTQAFIYDEFGGAASPMILPSLKASEALEVSPTGDRLYVGTEGPRSPVFAVSLPSTNSSPDGLAAEGRTLTDDCTVSQRGIPATGAYVGAAVGVNDDPSWWEGKLGAVLGVHRTYFSGDGVAKAVAQAEDDLAIGRIPWISFKLPHSWEEMARGAGDAWTRDLADRLARLDGPVWLALHHEPENDGDIRAWTAMQERLAPIVRERAPNVAYTIILTGWNQRFGPPQFRLGALWPDTEVDLLGIGPYNQYGVVENGRVSRQRRNFLRDYFRPVHRWAVNHGVAWGVAETGLTNRASTEDPRWLQRTYRELAAEGGVVFNYFNSTANSIADWTLDTPQETAAFAHLAKRAPTLGELLDGRRAAGAETVTGGTASGGTVTGGTPAARCR